MSPTHGSNTPLLLHPPNPVRGLGNQQRIVIGEVQLRRGLHFACGCFPRRHRAGHQLWRYLCPAFSLETDGMNITCTHKTYYRRRNMISCACVTGMRHPGCWDGSLKKWGGHSSIQHKVAANPAASLVGQGQHCTEAISKGPSPAGRRILFCRFLYDIPSPELASCSP